MKSNSLKVVSVGVLSSLLIFAPYSIKTNFTGAEESNVEKPLKEISFVSKDEKTRKIIEKIKVKKDESLDGLKKNFKEKSIKVESVDYNGAASASRTLSGLNVNSETNEKKDIVAKVDEVKADKELKTYLQQKIKEGNKVILYGNVTYKDYKNLLKIDSLRVKAKNNKGYLEFGTTTQENKKNVGKVLSEDKSDKGALKENAIDVPEEKSIIGYTLDENDQSQYFDVNVVSYDEKGQLRENDEEAYIQEILNYESRLTDERKVLEPTETDVSFVEKNITKAARKLVQERYGIVTAVYGQGNYVIGRIETDYRLFKHSSGMVNQYDYFSVRPLTQIKHYNGALAKSLKTTIATKYASDQLQSWSPKGDQSGYDFNLSLGFPFSLNVSMTFKDSISIDDQSSLSYDYASWYLNDPDMGGEVFEGMAGFASTGTYANFLLSNLGKFYIGPSNQYPVSGLNSINIVYDY